MVLHHIDHHSEQNVDFDVILIFVVHFAQILDDFEAGSEVLDFWILEDVIQDKYYIVEECTVFGHVAQEPADPVDVDLYCCLLNYFFDNFGILFLDDCLLFWRYGIPTFQQYLQQHPPVPWQRLIVFVLDHIDLALITNVCHVPHETLEALDIVVLVVSKIIVEDIEDPTNHLLVDQHLCHLRLEVGHLGKQQIDLVGLRVVVRHHNQLID